MRNILLGILLSLSLVSPVWAGASRSFDGTNDDINWGDIPAIDDATALSIGCWNFNDALTSDDIMVATRSTGDGFLFFFDDVGSVSGRTDIYAIFIQEDANTSTRVEGATGSAAATTWQWVVFTFLANTADTGLHLYIDGTEDANSPATTTSVADMGKTSLAVSFGEDNNLSRDKAGDLAHCQIWSRVITEAERTQARWFPETVPASAELITPLFGLDSPEIDLSANARTGTVNGPTESSDGPPVAFGGGLPL